MSKMIMKRVFSVAAIGLLLCVVMASLAAAHGRRHCSRYPRSYLVGPPVVYGSYYPATYYYGYPSYYYAYPAYGYGQGAYYGGSGVYFSVGF